MTDNPLAVETVRVPLVEKAVVALDQVQQATGLSRTDIINRAIQLYAHVQVELDAGSELAFLRDVHIVKGLRLDEQET